MKIVRAAKDNINRIQQVFNFKQTGARGPAGEEGPEGPEGPAGPAGPSGNGGVYVLDVDPTGGDDTTIVQTAIDAAIAGGYRFIRAEKDYDVQSDLTDRSNVIFIGPGSLGDVYRRKVIPWNAPTGLPDISYTVDPKRHLSEFNATDNPVVVLSGDSTSAIFPQSLGRSATLNNLLKEKLFKDSPDKTITFHNRAVGGQTYSTFVDVPSGNFPPWYTDQLKPWLEYIEELLPDTVFLAFGQNDTFNFNFADLQTAIATISGWTKVPDIVFLTPLVPSLEIDPLNAFASLSDEAHQEGDDYSAGYIRSWAVRNGYGYIDINRALNVVRDGRDIMNTALKRVVTDEDTTGTGKYTAPDVYKCRDFRLHASITGTAGEIAIKYNNVGNLMTVQMGRDTDDQLKVSTSGGNIKLDLYSGAGNLIFSEVTDTPVPVVPHSLNIEKHGTSLAFFIDEDKYSPEAFYTDKLVSHGGEFNPTIGYDGLAIGPVDEITFDMGHEMQFMPGLLNDEVWGESDATTDQKFPWGGQGVNHPTSLCGSSIISGVLDQLRFAEAKIIYPPDYVFTMNQLVEPTEQDKIDYLAALAPVGDGRNIDTSLSSRNFIWYVFAGLHMSLFNAPNGTELSAYVPDIGNNFVEVNGDWEITNNEAYCKVSGPGNQNHATTDAGEADISIEVLATSPVSGTFSIGILFNYQDSNNYWMCIIERNVSTGTNLYKLMKYQSGFTSYTELAPELPFSQDFKLKAITSGDNVKFLVNSRLVLERTFVGRSFKTATKHGMRLHGTSLDVRYKNLTILSNS